MVPPYSLSYYFIESHFSNMPFLNSRRPRPDTAAPSAHPTPRHSGPRVSPSAPCADPLFYPNVSACDAELEHEHRSDSPRVQERVLGSQPSTFHEGLQGPLLPLILLAFTFAIKG